MTEGSPLDVVLNATFTSSKDSEAILRSLTRSAGFTAENVLSRLAIARSISEGSLPSLELTNEGGGKQIRGATLLGKRGTAAALVIAMMHQQGDSQVDDVRTLVRGHWERGLHLLQLDTEAEGSIDEALAKYAQSAFPESEVCLKFESLARLRDPRVSIVGQERLTKSLDELIATSRSEQQIVLPPIHLIGDQGSGKSHVGRGIATSLGIPYCEVKPDGSGFHHLDEVLESENLIESIGDADLKVNPCVIGIAVEDHHSLTSGKRLVAQLTANSSSAGPALKAGQVILMSNEPQRSGAVKAFTVDNYSRDEVAEIIARRMGKWPLEVRRLLALAGRLTPGKALQRAEEFRTFASDLGARPSESLALLAMRERWELDRLGLSSEDYAQLMKLRESGVRPSEEAIGFLLQLNLIVVNDDSVEISPSGDQALTASGGKG